MKLCGRIRGSVARVIHGEKVDTILVHADAFFFGVISEVAMETLWQTEFKLPGEI